MRHPAAPRLGLSAPACRVGVITEEFAGCLGRTSSSAMIPRPSLPTPADLSDPAVIAAHDQAAFDAVETMVDHWDRPGWTAQTRAYY